MSLPLLRAKLRDDRAVARLLERALRHERTVVPLAEPVTHSGPHLLEAELSGDRVVRVLAHPDGAPEAEGQPLHLGVADRGQMAEILALIEQLDHKKAPRPPGSLESRIPVIEDAPTAATSIPRRPAAEVMGSSAPLPASAATPVAASRTDAYDDDDAPTLMQPSGKSGSVALAARPPQKGYVPSLALNLPNANANANTNTNANPHLYAGSTNPSATVKTNPAAFSDTLLPPSSFVERTLLLPIGRGRVPAPSAISPRGFEAEAAQVQERSAPAAAPSERRIAIPRDDGSDHPRVDPRAEDGPTELHVRPTRARDARAEPARPAAAAASPTAAYPASQGSSGSSHAFQSRDAPAVHASHAPSAPVAKPTAALAHAPAAAPGAAQHASGPGGQVRLLGRTIAGKYTIDSSIGRGATAEVFRAQHASLKRPVAVKILHQENAGYLQFVKRFKAEAHTLSKLEHQNIARVIDFGQEPDGLLYLVMELLVGKSLEVVLGDSGKRLPVKKVLDVGVQTCNALAFAHDEGVIHRDVKPENVVLVPHRDEDGKPCDLVKVCDFGLAKLRDPDPENTDITMGGTLCGSPAYMSPEQILGEKLDARTDLFALATMLYESLTGELPHDAVGLTQLFAKKLMEAPTPIRSYLPDIDPGLEATIMRGLSRERNARQDDARVLRQELRAVLSRLG